MPSLIGLCKKYFGQDNLYDVLGIPKTANAQQVKKAYHKLSLKVHPDRVEESEKEEATEKFKVLGKIHSILSDKERRSVYDITGSIDEEDECMDDFDWSNYWKSVFRPISKQDIQDYEKKYKNSLEEAHDLKKAYLAGEGNIDMIYQFVPFSSFDEETRLKGIIQRMIDDGEVPAFDIFVNEPPEKAERRRKKYEREARRAKAMTTDFDPTGEETLRLLIDSSRKRDRGEQMNKFFDHLEAKYARPAKKKSGAITQGQKRKRATK